LQLACMENIAGWQVSSSIRRGGPRGMLAAGIFFSGSYRHCGKVGTAV
jgi:hypothetical protein